MTRIFYHAIDPQDMLFANNIMASFGLITAVSFARDVDPNLAVMRSPYEAFTREYAKEEVFEKVRNTEFPLSPPRLGTIFLFPSLQKANKANLNWWGGKRVILEAMIKHANRFGEFDAAHLDSPQSEWTNAARDYWSGSVKSTSSVEVLVDGIVELIGWEPFGRLISEKVSSSY